MRVRGPAICVAAGLTAGTPAGCRHVEPAVRRQVAAQAAVYRSDGIVAVVCRLDLIADTVPDGTAAIPVAVAAMVQATVPVDTAGAIAQSATRLADMETGRAADTSAIGIGITLVVE